MAGSRASAPSPITAAGRRTGKSGDSPVVTLYDCATAPSPRRARILLAEKGVPHEAVQVDLRTGEQLGEAYRLINPQCTVPALVTDEGPVLTDKIGRAHV